MSFICAWQHLVLYIFLWSLILLSSKLHDRSSPLHLNMKHYSVVYKNDKNWHLYDLHIMNTPENHLPSPTKFFSFLQPRFLLFIFNMFVSLQISKKLKSLETHTILSILLTLYVVLINVLPQSWISICSNYIFSFVYFTPFIFFCWRPHPLILISYGYT